MGAWPCVTRRRLSCTSPGTWATENKAFQLGDILDMEGGWVGGCQVYFSATKGTWPCVWYLYRTAL